MPLSGTALLIVVGLGLAWYGGEKAAHGISHLVHKVVHKSVQKPSK